MADPEFYSRKKVLITGHTGFKGSWLCKILLDWGADLVGYSLAPEESDSIFERCGLASSMDSIMADIRDYETLLSIVQRTRPEIVLHLAAQPLVIRSYKEPRYTYDVNVMGTVNLLEAIRQTESTLSVVNVTTDKVYHNREWIWSYRENDPLDGGDPYSNSKSCSELVTHSYAKSFFANTGTAVSTARAGNVIGAGDFSENRIIPDCVRAIHRQETIKVRSPHSVRPYQHVLEPLFAYLLIAQEQYTDGTCAGWYNIGPDDCDCITTETLVNLFCEYWDDEASWEQGTKEAFHEADLLKLDSAKMKHAFNWKPHWSVSEAVKYTVEGYKTWQQNNDFAEEMSREIRLFKGNN